MRNPGILAAATLLLSPLAVAGQDAVATNTSRTGEWTAWYGCWRAVDDTPVRVSPVTGIAERPEPSAPAPLLCALPGDDAATVRIATIDNGAIADETVVRADGVARPIAEGGCSGTERAFFSADGQRVYTRAELGCTGLGRTSTGVLAMVSEAEWIDAQALTVNGQHAVRTIRYRAVASDEVPESLAALLPQNQHLAQETARLSASAPIGIDAVIEASGIVAAPALQALLAARKHGFGLNAANLTRLADSGVEETTIDVMVGLSYPDRFVVAREPQVRSADLGDLATAERNAARAWVDDCYDPYFRTNRYSCEGRYGYGYGYRGYGYRGYGYGYDPYGWNYGSRPVVVVVQPPDTDPDPRGTVVKGRGYTRGGATGSEPSRRSTRRDDGARATATQSSGSSTTSSSGSSSGSSGSSGETRTAKKRGN